MSQRGTWKNGERTITARTQIWHPTYRAVVLWVWFDDDGALCHEVEPVLGMEARTLSIQEGENDLTETYHYPITASSLPTACDSDFLEECVADFAKTVVCTWPPESR